MVRPPFLKKGDHVGIAAPARKINAGIIIQATRLLKQWGFRVVTGLHLFDDNHQLAGTDEARAEDLQRMLDDPELRAILCARGGYGTVRIIDRLDFSAFRKYPKWIAGYSDITVLHSHIHTNLAIETIHSTMPYYFGEPGVSEETFNTLRNVLTGVPLSYTFNSLPLSRPGTARGPLVGGNLSILCSIAGSLSDIDTNGKILFLEDLDEYLYHVDRMMVQLKRLGKLERLAGLIIGGLTDMKDNTVPFGKTAEQIIAEAVKEYSYPVCFGFPAGHLPDNRAMVLGREAMLRIGGGIGEFQQNI
jgi:muramoyltetrapeptide carboxypeptidase